MDISYCLSFVTLMVIFCLPDLYGASNNGEEWVDPDPLSKFNRDRASPPVKKESRNLAQENEDCMKIEETSAVKRKLQHCLNLLNNYSKQLHDLKHNLSSPSLPKDRSHEVSMQKEECVQVKLYMKRFINILLKVSKLNEDMPQNLNTHLHITATLEQLKVLQQFSEGSQDVTLQELDQVMSSILLPSKLNTFFEDHVPWSAVTHFFQSREMLLTLFFGCLCVFLIWKILNGHSVLRIMTMFTTLLFIWSFTLVYLRMIKQAEIKQYAVMKVNADVPAECLPQSGSSWWSWLFGTTAVLPDICQKYYETLMGDPFLEVTPTIVLSEMVAGFFFHPAGMLGSAIGDFSKNVLASLPWGVNLMVLFASFGMIGIIIFASCGGVVRLRNCLGVLEFSGQRPQEKLPVGSQKSQVFEQVEQSSGHSVLNEAAISKLMQTADSVDTGLVLMNITGVRRLMSAGGTTVVQRDIIDAIQQPSLNKMCVHHVSEQNNKSESHHPEPEDGTVTVGSGCLQQPLSKNQTEETQLRMRSSVCISEDKHIQIQRAEVVKKPTIQMQQKDGIEEFTSADKDASSYNRAASTIDSSEVGASDVDEEVKRCRSSSIDVSDEAVSRCRSSSIDVSDEEIGFVKL